MANEMDRSRGIRNTTEPEQPENMGYRTRRGTEEPARMGMENGQSKRTMSMRGNINIMSGGGDSWQEVEDIYSILDERMCLALCFHEQLADYFCFLGLQGFKRMCEYQYMTECAEKRKLHKRYIDMHHRIIPVQDGTTRAGMKPNIIPKEWERYTTHDVDDSIMPKYVRMALKEYYEWESETKDIYHELCSRLMQLNLYTDYDFVKELAADAEKEIKKITHLMESLSGTGYDVTAIHSMQDKYHEKYKNKYNEKFTKKHNQTGFTVNADNPSRAYKK